MHSRPSWLHETRILLRLHWRPLLAIVVVTELVSAGVGIAGTLAAIRAVDVFPGLDGTIGVALVFMVPAVLAGMCNAWAWAAVVEVCRSAGAGRRVGVAVALRQGLGPRHEGYCQVIHVRAGECSRRWNVAAKGCDHPVFACTRLGRVLNR